MIKKTGPNRYRVAVPAPRDPVTGKRRQLVRSVTGTRADARRVQEDLGLLARGEQVTGTDETLEALLLEWFDCEDPRVSEVLDLGVSRPSLSRVA